jgi:hypothetical protein
MMNKKQIYSTVIACVAISATLVASSLIAGIQFTQPALAQTAAAPTTTPPPPPAPAKKTAATAGEPPLGKQVNWQGTVSSLPTVPSLTGRSRGDQVAVILPPRKDSGLYTGVLTFTASKPVAVQVWNQLNGVSSTTLIPREFGAIALSSASPTGKSYALALVGPPGTSGSVPFTGNGIALHGTAPFIATYSLTATTSPATVKNNITSATTAAATLGTAAGGGPSLGGSSSGGGPSSGTTLGSERGAPSAPQLGTGSPARSR